MAIFNLKRKGKNRMVWLNNKAKGMDINPFLLIKIFVIDYKIFYRTPILRYTISSYIYFINPRILYLAYYLCFLIWDPTITATRAISIPPIKTKAQTQTKIANSVINMFCCENNNAIKISANARENIPITTE